MDVFIFLFNCYCVLFIISILLDDNSIVDVFWWMWFWIVASMLFVQGGDYSLTKIIVLCLVLLWAVRISVHIGKKKIKKPWEDPRYAQWRKEWKYFLLRSFFQVYMLQMILLILVSFPLYIIFTSSWTGSVILLIIGSIISLSWLLYESIADIQLDRYLANTPPKNTIFTGWLFRYSRHPNYLWEIVFWLGILIISLQYWLWGLIGFGTIAWLLLYVSWVPMKEIRYKRKWNWEEYSQKTPKFIPDFSLKDT